MNQLKHAHPIDKSPKLAKRSTTRVLIKLLVVAMFSSILPAISLPQPVAAQSSCADVSVDDLDLTFPGNNCHYKVIDIDNGWSEHCTSWANNNARTCRELVNGHRYKVDKWTANWAGAGSQRFTASGTTSDPEPPSTTGGPIDSLNTTQRCVSPSRPGTTRNFARWNEWRACGAGGYDTETRSWFTERRYSNYLADWTGTGSVTRSSNSRAFSIRWRNTNQALPQGKHAEFDISVGRSWRSGGVHGYGTETANTIGSRKATLTSSGRFTRPLSAGKAHVQAIIWLTKNKNSDYNSNCPSRDSVDITVVEWLSNSTRKEYDRLRTTNSTAGTTLSSKTEYVSSVNLGGVPYWLFERTPGDVCERVSYFLLRRWNQGYTSGYKYSKIDIAETIDDVTAADNTTDLRNWYVSYAGWEIAGGNQSQGSGGGDAEFKFSCISLPKLKNSSTSASISSAC